MSTAYVAAPIMAPLSYSSAVGAQKPVTYYDFISTYEWNGKTYQHSGRYRCGTSMDGGDTKNWWQYNHHVHQQLLTEPYIKLNDGRYVTGAIFDYPAKCYFKGDYYEWTRPAPDPRAPKISPEIAKQNEEYAKTRPMNASVCNVPDYRDKSCVSVFTKFVKMRDQAWKREEERPQVSGKAE